MSNPKKGREILKNVGFNLLLEGKTIRIKAHGYSMYPCIRPGSIVLIEPLKLKGKPQPGEIIAVRRETGLVVHRLVRIVKKDGADFYVARGDSNARADHPVGLNMIAGRIVKVETDTGIAFPLDVKPRSNMAYIMNRLRVIWIILWGKIKRKAKSL